MEWVALVLALVMVGAAVAQDPNEPEKEAFAAVMSSSDQRQLLRFPF